ncbi:MAG: YgfZ/GcvT domain-containing protein [Opitutia bacterium]
MPLRFTALPAAALRVTGGDAAAYLQGQCTADLRPGSPAHALWLNRKGRVMAHTFIVPEPDGSFLLLAERTSAARLNEVVLANAIADDVVTSDESSAWTWGVIEGTAEPPLPIGAQAFSCARLPGAEAHAYLGPPGLPPGCVPADFEALERQRILAGVPVVPDDCGEGEFPQECGLEAWVSYDKGCYLGQEVMARIRSMGALRRVLRLVRGRGPLVPGTQLRSADGRPAGTVRSASGEDGLALVLVDLAEGAELASDGGAVRLGPAAALPG